MKNNIKIFKLEDLTENHYEQIKKLIIDTWDYRSWLNNEDVEPMADYLLSNVLLSASVFYIGIECDTIIGVISLSLSDNPMQDSKLEYKKLCAISKLIRHENKNSIFGKYIDTLKINELLLQKNKIAHKASMTLFVVNENYRGMGIGNVLYAEFINYLIQNEIDSFSLFTDSASNYLFYEKKGMSRVGIESFNWNQGGEEENEDYYLYECKLSCIS